MAQASPGPALGGEDGASHAQEPSDQALRLVDGSRALGENDADPLAGFIRVGGRQASADLTHQADMLFAQETERIFVASSPPEFEQDVAEGAYGVHRVYQPYLAAHLPR
jgi:hypothetical protein